MTQTFFFRFVRDRYREEEQRAASLSKQYLRDRAELCSMNLLEAILDDGEAKGEPSQQKPTIKGQSRVHCDRCYQEILITLIMKRAYYGCSKDWEQIYMPKRTELETVHLHRRINATLDGPCWLVISEGILDYPDLLLCSTWHV